jgi:two-component system, OmpR family, response regulator
VKVLIVEDEHKIANSIRKGLLQEAYVVDVAYDGQTGFDLAAGEDYDVIVLDLMLPKISGMEICRRLRQEEKIQIPILILTAKGELDDRVAGLNAGADDYLVKPFAFAELLARLRALSRRPKNHIGQVLQAGNLVLDTNGFLVKRGNKEIKLSRKEYALLKYLLAQRGKVVSKQQIIDHVWDYEANILPNTVEVFIGYLRKKIDQPFSKEPALIKTVRGFGYKIENSKEK